MAERRLVKSRVESSNLSSSANGRIAPMVEHHVEAVTVQVRILLVHIKKNKNEKEYTVHNDKQDM